MMDRHNEVPTARDVRQALTLVVIACALVLAASHYGASKVADYRCAHGISTPCRSAR